MIAHVISAMQGYDSAKKKAKKEYVVVCQGKTCGKKFMGIKGELCPHCNKDIGV